MSRVPQAKGGAKSNLAKALAAGIRAARASGKTSDKGRSHSRSRSPRRAVSLHAAWKRHCAGPRRWTFAAQRRRSRGRGSVRQRPRRKPQPRVGSVPPEQDQRVRGFQRVCGSASFWSTGCGRCCGCWSLRQMERQLGQRCPPSFLEGRRQAQRVLGSHSVQGLGYCSRRCPFLFVHEVLASLVEKHAGDVSSFTAIPQQLWSMKRNFCANHGINDDLTLGVGLHRDGVAHLKRTTVECFSWNVLASDSAERYLFGLVEKDAW